MHLGAFAGWQSALESRPVNAIRGSETRVFANLLVAPAEGLAAVKKNCAPREILPRGNLARQEGGGIGRESADYFQLIIFTVAGNVRY